MEQELERVDAVVKTHFPGLSRRQVEEAIESGLIIGADGKRLKKGDHVPPLEVQCRRLAEQLESLSKGNRSLPVKIIAEEPDFVVVNKPAGMPSQPKSLFDARTLTNWALARYPSLKTEFPEPQPSVTPYPVDTDIGGLVVVAKTTKGFQLWKEYFDKQQVGLSYLAWCWGEPKQHRLFISAPIGRVSGDPNRRVLATPGVVMDPPARDAVSVVRVVEVKKRPEKKGFFLAELQIVTNIEHQVRLHMASQGFPVMGDPLYDPEFLARPEKIETLQLLISELEHAGRRAKISTDVFKKRFG